MDPQLYDISVEALRLIFLFGVPVVVAMGLVGTLLAVFQAATTWQDSALGYAVRVVTVIVLVYAMLPKAAESLMRLAESAFT